MSDEPSGAQKLIAQTMGAHRSYYNHGDDYDRCTGCKWRGHAPAEHEAHVATEVDKALGGLDRAWAAVWPDDSYLTPWHEKWNFHPNKSARELAEVDVADHEGTTLGSRWSSGWTVTE
ncbi:hypothetical protein PP563_09890 [Mycobacteroides abscessus]|nr:hypothetical protein [Mycobacteroides abscessus]MDM2179555.1 hypothetical protein [Mycobacteroides abscessus]MDM2209635.1 hypothetical protein [Mycobacteroides abscessus]MDM2214594.1 hypothetical protein [Mycobacteroides abscessus]MDM2219588.1 hypothetical protein [Mycobacteroides abscessus]